MKKGVIMNLSQKYRPTKFEDILGQEDIIFILRNQIAKKRIGSSYLFLGPSGSGKTTTARVLAMAMNCEHPIKGNPCGRCNSCQSMKHGPTYDVVELDIGSYRGIDSIKQIEMTTKFMPFGKKKIYILDEVHALTPQAWDATLKMLEDCGDHILFILCSSENDVPEVARSRCQEFTFQRLESKTIAKKLAIINQKERFGLDLNSLRFIAEFAQGNMRSAEMMLTQVINLNHGNPKPRQIRKFLQMRMQ
jgi:DNA polymerase-3 subunit gamma/tau